MILAGSCILNLIFAINAGQKRKTAVLRLDNADARLSELELRYKNAIQSYDALQKELQDSKKDLEQNRLFADSLKEALQKEQKVSQGLREELEKVKSLLSVSNKTVISQKPQAVKKTDRTTRKW